MPNSSDQYKTNLLIKVPWEPYKAATSKSSSNKSSISSIHQTSSQTNVNKNDLVRYNISTNLKIFNANRPGSEFDDEDIDTIKKTNIFDGNDESLFVDARFYPDLQFLKMAEELKSKCLELNNPILKTSNTNNKPINVVGPLIENKSVKSNETNNKISKPQMTKHELRIEYLENQMKGINEHLKIQTQINAELKKLLVASMGEDIQYKIERLVSDKKRLEFELENNKQTINKMHDEIDQYSIKCDLWRSKYLACRLMADEASSWKSFLLLLNKQNERVLDNLLKDNGLLNSKLNQALELLNVKEKQNDNSQKIEEDIKKCNNLQVANMLLLGLKNKKKNIPIEDLNALNFRNMDYLKTANEEVGAQMLEQFDWVKHAMKDNTLQGYSINKNYNDESVSYIDSFDKLEELINRIKVSRSTIHSRLFQNTEMSGDFDLLLNCCNACNGKIKTV